MTGSGRAGEAEWTKWRGDHPETLFTYQTLSESFPELTARLEAVPERQRSASFYQLLGDCQYEAADYAGAAVAFQKALRTRPGDLELRHNQEVSQDAARIVNAITPQLARELRRHARRHPEERVTEVGDDDRPNRPPIERFSQPDLVIFSVRRVSPDRIIVLSGGSVRCGDFRQDVTHHPNLRLSLWTDTGSKMRRLWASSPFEEMVRPDDSENPDKEVDLRTLDLSGDGDPEAIVTLIQRSRYVGPWHGTNTTTYIYQATGRRLVTVAKLKGDSKYDDPASPWIANLGELALRDRRQHGGRICNHPRSCLD